VAPSTLSLNPHYAPKRTLMPVIAAHELSLAEVIAHPFREMIYCGFDSPLTHEINAAFDRELPDGGRPLIYDFERALQGPVLEMQLRGFRVDPSARETAITNTRRKREAAQTILDTLAGAVWDKGVNANSGQQLKDLFYNHMGIRPLAMSVKGERKEPMDRKILERLEDYFYPRPLVNAILLIRDLDKTLQVLETEIDSDWRFRTSYNIGGTDSFRFSSSKSGLGTGGNFQNVHAELRRIFIPDPGWKLYGLDKEQAESREVGFLCGVLFDDWSYLDAAESGDVHTYVTRMVYPEWNWTGDLRKDRELAEKPFYRTFTYRDASKRLSHGSNYYGKPPALSQQIRIPINLVFQFQERYFSAFPCIRRLHTWVARELQTKQALYNVFGVRRDFFDRPDQEETLRSAIAHLFQSATAHDTNLGLYRIWKSMRGRVQVLAQLHDAVYFQAREDDDEEAVVAEATELMKVELSHRGRKFIVPTEAKSGFNWAPRYRQDADGKWIEWNKAGLDKIGAKR